jgi:hypothetical protein
MFVYGKKGEKFPYSIKILTQMQISQLLLNRNVVSSKTILFKGLICLSLFNDSASNYQFGFQDPATFFN